MFLTQICQVYNNSGYFNSISHTSKSEFSAVLEDGGLLFKYLKPCLVLPLLTWKKKSKKC